MSGILASTFFPAVAVWLPTNLSTLVGWFDASDSSTITDDGSGHCSQWNDRSSNSNNLTPQSATKPAINTGGINSLNTLTFTTNSGMQKLAASGLPGNAAGIGFGAVLAPTSLATTAAISLGNHVSTNDETALFFFATSVAHYRTDNVAASQASITYSDATHPHTFSGTCSTTLRDLYLDGTQGTSQSTLEASQNSVDFILGRQIGAVTTGTAGKYAEVVLFSGASTTDRQMVEGYLAWKWGLQGNLPNGHPYKNAPP